MNLKPTKVTTDRIPMSIDGAFSIWGYSSANYHSMHLALCGKDAEGMNTHAILVATHKDGSPLAIVFEKTH